ncbi:uncharacterized protein N0V89_008101 [Didymosphaeria variabile]|uniref:RRM domain-containing protein n=1 Tax=Didymosphaeria variabile TaxID=1932322 RepID=A0A9W8XFB4_9PLEO|nr:uncharacterized protein N0V89_008101 [Didymosphaeria variabile]KAJ4349485.1 hypothetical protein N0V89_008101 [Didymosphaeria variabile]
MPRGEKVALGDISVPEDRVLRATNFHWNATDADVNEFFDGYGLVDWKRSINVKSGKSTVAYILLSTLENVVRATEELNWKELLGRQVRLMRAKGGFQLTASGLLNLTDSDREVTFGKHFTPFPPLGPPQATSTSGASSMLRHRPRIEMFRARQHGRQPDFDGPQHRVLLISKLHPDADRNAVVLFFQGFRIVDYKRKYNDRLGKYNTTAFVLFESVQDRDRAKATKNGQKIFGREVSLDVAIRGIRVSNDGFLPDNADIVSPPRSQLRPEARSFRNEGSTAPATVVSADRRFGVYHTPMADQTVGLRFNINNGASVVDDPHRWAHSDNHNYSHEQHRRYHNENLITKARGHVYAQSPHNIHDKQADFSHAPWSETTFPTNNQVSSRRGLGPWNLAGNDSKDKEHNVLTEEEWYGFQ